MPAHILFNLVPVSPVVADIFARRADGQQAGQQPHLAYRFLQPVDGLPTFPFVPAEDDCGGHQAGQSHQPDGEIGEEHGPDPLLLGADQGQGGNGYGDAAVHLARLVAVPLVALQAGGLDIERREVAEPGMGRACAHGLIVLAGAVFSQQAQGAGFPGIGAVLRTDRFKAGEVKADTALPVGDLGDLASHVGRVELGEMHAGGGDQIPGGVLLQVGIGSGCPGYRNIDATVERVPESGHEKFPEKGPGLGAGNGGGEQDLPVRVPGKETIKGERPCQAGEDGGPEKRRAAGDGVLLHRLHPAGDGQGRDGFLMAWGIVPPAAWFVPEFFRKEYPS